MWLLTYNFYYMFGSSLNTKTAVSLIHMTFGVFTAVNMKMAFFWDVTPCSFVCLWYRVGTSTGKSNWCLVTSPRTMSYLNFVLYPALNLFSPPFPFRTTFITSFPSESLLKISYQHYSHFQCHYRPLHSPSLCLPSIGAFLCDLLFCPEDGGISFLQDIGT